MFNVSLTICSFVLSAAISSGHSVALITLGSFVAALLIANIVLRVLITRKRKEPACETAGESSTEDAVPTEESDSNEKSDEDESDKSDAEDQNVVVVADADDDEDDDADEDDEDEDEDDDEDDDEDEDKNGNAAAIGVGVGVGIVGGLGVAANGRRGLNYSFRARLIQATDEMKARYVGLVEDAGRYKKVACTESWKKVRIHRGRKMIGVMIFRGKTLALALPLQPADYENTKYHFKDVSDKKRYEATPMLVKLTSDRQLKYAKELMAKVCEENDVQLALIPTPAPVAPKYEEKEALIEKNLIRDRSRK